MALKLLHDVSDLRCGESNLLQLSVMPKHLLWCPVIELLSSAHHHEAIRIFRDILHAVRHKDHREPALLPQLTDLIENLVASLRIQSRRRLIENQHLRPHRQHSGDRNAALLASRELKGRLSVIALIQSHHAQRLPGPRFYLILWQAHIFRPEADV